MNPKPLHDRIIGALALSPMTIAQLAACLSANHLSVRAEVSGMHESGVLAPGGFRGRQQVHQLAGARLAA